MKITIEEKKNEPKRVYPYLAKAKSGIIVAFGSPGIGVAVPCGGLYIDPGFDFIEENFEPIHPQPEPKPIPVEQRKYPYVGRYNYIKGFEVFFTNKRTGIVIKGGDSSMEAGDCSTEFFEENFTHIPVSKIIVELD